MNEKFTLPIFEPEGADSRVPFTSRRDLLEESKLSRLAPLEKKLCENCYSALDGNDQYQIDISICRSCLKTYAVVGSQLDKYTERKIRRNYLGGVKR